MYFYSTSTSTSHIYTVTTYNSPIVGLVELPPSMKPLSYSVKPSQPPQYESLLFINNWAGWGKLKQAP